MSGKRLSQAVLYTSLTESSEGEKVEIQTHSRYSLIASFS